MTGGGNGYLSIQHLGGRDRRICEVSLGYGVSSGLPGLHRGTLSQKKHHGKDSTHRSKCKSLGLCYDSKGKDTFTTKAEGSRASPGNHRVEGEKRLPEDITWSPLCTWHVWVHTHIANVISFHKETTLGLSQRAWKWEMCLRQLRSFLKSMSPP